MSQMKRPSGCPITHVLPLSCSVEYPERCPGRKQDGKCRVAENEQPVHLVWEVQTHTVNVQLTKEQPVQHLEREMPL